MNSGLRIRFFFEECGMDLYLRMKLFKGRFFFLTLHNSLENEEWMEISRMRIEFIRIILVKMTNLSIERINKL